MNKKIGILTYHYSNNYGAVLQAYSLKSILLNEGFDVEIINLVPNHGVKGKIKELISNSLVKGFTDFRNERFKLYPMKSFTYDRIDTIDFSKFHSLIVGSDQVWRKDYTKGLGYSYFLDFAPDDVKKIAYAASFGLDFYQGNSNDIVEVKKALNKFDLVTVRENSGVKICKEVFNIDSTMVLDPVLLSLPSVYDFNQENNTKKGNFVTQYLLDATNEKMVLSKLISKTLHKELVINYKENTGKLSILNLLFDKNKEIFPKIENWISNLKNTDFVITDSFHGVAFSILFNKQFICIFNEKRGKTRMQNLLSIFNLNHRGISEVDIKSFSLKNLQPINYSVVNVILEEKKKFSLALLLKNLK